MATYKYINGTNEQIYDLLTIDNDGRMSLEWHGTDRVLRYDDVELRDSEFGYGTRLHFGKNSNLPWTNAKGEQWKQWQCVEAPAAVTEGTTEGTPAASIPAAADTPEAAAPSPTPQPARKPRQRKAKAAQQPASSPVSGCTTAATDEDAPAVADNQPNDTLATLRSIFVELLVTTVCTLIFWFSLSHASLLGAAIAIGMLAAASRMGLTPIMTAAALEG